MKFLLDELEAQQQGSASVYSLSALQRRYHCRCGRAVFFRNSQCLRCDAPLGYEPALGRVFALSADAIRGQWRIDGQAGVYRRCANLNTPAACNWLVPVSPSPDHAYCISCRLNRTIPNLSAFENGVYWGRLEDAKRRVISALIALQLPVASRVTEDPQRGLAFEFLCSPPNGPRVITGHRSGIITINIEEADDVKREQVRTSMHEPYRTLVGHFRHEMGHYYWDRLVRSSAWQYGFRELFGDERQDYPAALRRNYQEGPRSNWAQSFISAYASVHPWEDWAETWAHYMHMVDTLGTAMSFGLMPDSIAMPFDPFGPEALYQLRKGDADRFLSFLNAWIKLTAVMNELCRSMGQPDFYPFVLPTAAVKKLHYIHMVVCESRQGAPASER